MNHLKLFESYQSESKVAKICRKYGIKNWSINSDGLVDVDGEVDLSVDGLKKIPLKFGEVTGGFLCWDNELTSLEGAPHTVGYFVCNLNQLTSLEFAPKKVRNYFDCRNNNIRSFEGPINIRSDFRCWKNPIYEIWKIINPIDDNWDNEKMDFFNDLDIIRGEEIAIERLNFFLEEMGSPTTVESVKGYKNIY
jgi:hypothetical protein